MARRYRLDTNVLLRFLRGDHPDHSPAARSLFALAESGRCTLVLDAVVVAEAVWVLTSYYKTDRAAVSDALGAMLGLPGIDCAEPAVVGDALERFGATGVDFIDCYIAAGAAARGEAVASFDADFDRLTGVSRIDPRAFVDGG